MNQSSLGEQIRALNTVLAGTTALDSETRSHVIALQRECQRLLNAPLAAPIDQISVKDHLEELAVRFEAEHPAIGTAIRQTIDTLVKAGI